MRGAEDAVIDDEGVEEGEGDGGGVDILRNVFDRRRGLALPVEDELAVGEGDAL